MITMKKVLFMIGVASVLLISCSQNKQGNRMRGDDAREYSVITVAPRSVTIHQDFPATMEGQRVIEIRPMINGYLQDIYVNEGDQVKKGQLLFRINMLSRQRQKSTVQMLMLIPQLLKLKRSGLLSIRE